MKKSPKKSTSKKLPDDAAVDAFLKTLNGPADRAALQLIGAHGVFDVPQAGQHIREAVDSLMDDEPGAWERRHCELSEKIGAEVAFVEYEDMIVERMNEIYDSAYLLGIAVGRRLANGLAQPKGGAR